MIPRRTVLLDILLCSLLGILIRLHFIWSGGFAADADEAIVGIMARHISMGLPIPIFYYGQDYMGSLEAILTAGVFLFSPPSPAMLKVVPLFFSGLHILLVYFLARAVATLSLKASPQGARSVALAAALLTAIGPQGLIDWSTKARGGFIEIVVISTASLLLTTQIISKNTLAARHLYGLAFLLGIGWWTNNQIIFAIAAIGLTLLAHTIRLLSLKALTTKDAAYKFLGSCVFFLLGSAPFWWWNLARTPRFSTFKQLLSPQAPAHISEQSSNVTRFITESVPILLGGRRFWSTDDLFLGSSLVAIIVFGFTLLVIIISTAIRLRRRPWNEQLPVLMILSFVIATIGIFCASQFGWLTKAPRYLLPLYSVMYVLVAAAAYSIWRARHFIPVKSLRRSIASLFIIIPVALNLTSLYKGGVAVPGMDLVFAGNRIIRDHTPLYEWLRTHRYNHVYTNYWIGYRIAFETNEEITFSVYDTPRSVRIPHYERTDPEGERVYVLVESQRQLLTRELSALGYSYKVEKVGGYWIVHEVFPLSERGQKIIISPDMLSVSHGADSAQNLVDDNQGNRWKTSAPQSPGMEVVIRFPKPTIITGLDLNLGYFYHDAPRHLTIEALLESGAECTLSDLHDTALLYDITVRNFDEVPTLWSFYFEPQTVVGLRLSQRGSDAIFDWSIAELTVFGAPTAVSP